MKDASGLTPKQLLFVERYLDHGNATQAYREAGYVASTQRAQEVNSSRMLRNAEVRKVIEAARQESLKRIQVNSDWVLERLKSNADAHIGKFARVSGGRIEILDTDDLDEDALRAVGGFTISESSSDKGESRSVSVKAKDSNKALEMLAKHLRMFDEPSGKNDDPANESGGLSEAFKRLGIRGKAS